MIFGYPVSEQPARLIKIKTRSAGINLSMIGVAKIAEEIRPDTPHREELLLIWV